MTGATTSWANASTVARSASSSSSSRVATMAFLLGQASVLVNVN